MSATIDIAKLPPDFLASCRAIGERNARDVARFLRAFGIGKAPNDESSPTVSLPRELMLGLALVVELNRWEQSRITVHLAAGLPSSTQFLDTVMRLLKGPELSALVECLSLKVGALSCKHFLWSAQADQRADVAVVVESDFDPIDAIADFLWQHRHTPSIPGGEK